MKLSTSGSWPVSSAKKKSPTVCAWKGNLAPNLTVFKLFAAATDAAVFDAAALEEAAPVRALRRPLVDAFGFELEAPPAAFYEAVSAPTPAAASALFAAIKAVCVA